MKLKIFLCLSAIEKIKKQYTIAPKAFLILKTVKI